nr:TEV-HA protein [synthetic construct]
MGAPRPATGENLYFQGGSYPYDVPDYAYPYDVPDYAYPYDVPDYA